MRSTDSCSRNQKRNPIDGARKPELLAGAGYLNDSVNYVAHTYRFLDDPYFAAGTGVPDWLAVADRKVRVRRKHAKPLAEDSDPVTASVARGVLQRVLPVSVYELF